MSKVVMTQYDAYKDSGVEWLGDMPEHWAVKRIKDLSMLQSGDSIVSEQIEEEGKYPVYGGNGLRGYYSKYTNNGEYILIGRQGALCGNINYASGKFWASEHAVVTYLKRSIDMKWYGEMLRIMNLNQYSLAAAQPGLAMDRIRRLLLPVPTLPEQTTIAAYLDTKTAQIDRKIDLLTQKATQYGKLKQSLINETVTRGLDKTVAMKDSGVEWIGEVPEHWEVNRLKDIFNERTDKGYPNEPLLIASQDKGVTLKASYSRHTMTVQKNFHTQKLVKKADFVISLRSFEGGIETAHYRGIISAAYTIMYPINEQGSGYYKHLFKSSKFISLLVTHTTGIREGRNINYQQLKRDVIPVPNPVERQKIASYLDTKTAHIDRIIETINTQFDKLKELRKTLINDVVTGKIKVA